MIVNGILRGFDQLLNVVLDDTIETVRRLDEPEVTRQLGLIVARGPNIVSIAPEDGIEEIDNPFVSQAD